jgi:hypothetical protein
MLKEGKAYRPSSIGNHQIEQEVGLPSRNVVIGERHFYCSLQCWDTLFFQTGWNTYLGLEGHTGRNLSDTIRENSAFHEERRRLGLSLLEGDMYS